MLPSCKSYLACRVDSAVVASIHNTDMTNTLLAGLRSATNICTLLQFRRQVLNRYLRVDLPQLGVRLVLETLWTVLADHDSYLKTVHGMNEAVDTTWKARCQQTGRLALQLFDDCAGLGQVLSFV